MLAKYHVSKKDFLDFETFYQLYLELTTEDDNPDQDVSKSEYSI